MRIACIGDIHGRSIWKDVVKDAAKNSDIIIFLGDYIDPYEIEDIKTENIITKFESYQKNLYDKYNSSDDDDDDDKLSDDDFYAKYYKKYPELKQPIYPSHEEMLETLEELITLKKKNMKQIILLIGNHDAHYLFPEISQSERYDYKNAMIYKKIYRENMNLFQYAYQYKNYLFTHAGVTNTWLDFYDETIYSFGLKNDLSNIAHVLNKMGNESFSNKILNIPGKKRGGTSLSGGITWADYNESFDDFLVGLNQVVGHSKVNYIHTETINGINGSITYCDVLEENNKNMKNNYYIVNV